MYILAIETTGAFASVALLKAKQMKGGSGSDLVKTSAEDPGEILGVIHGNDRFSHLQNLTPQIQQILKESELQIGDMTAVAVSHGPGSFTGIRIGVSTARALAQVLDIPCIAVSSLEALALRAEEQAACQSAAGGETEPLLVCPILDARRKQVYGAAYELVDGAPVCRIEPASCLMTEFLEKLDRYADEASVKKAASEPWQVLFLGDGIDTCGDIIEAWSRERPAFAVAYGPEEIRYQDAAAVARRGLQLYREGKTCGYMQLQPEYLRMAEAEKKLRDRQAAETKKPEDSR